jgi:GH25 family lysozyme M1 (1,4-beta-N-acetylmuramidase)
MRRTLAAITGLAVVAGIAGLTAMVPERAGAAAARASEASAVRTGRLDRFNVDATHSPQLHRMLVKAAAEPPRRARSRAASLPAGLYAVQGIDVASFQHKDRAAIDWADVATAGYSFAFVKVSEGSYYLNPYYAADFAGARSAGLVVAPYAFAIPNYSGGALQADYALDSAGQLPDGQSLPLILDLEYDPYAGRDGTPGGSWCYGLTPTQMVAWISAFVTEAQRRTGELPIIYTIADWWAKCTGSSTAFAADPLWVASYGGSSPTLPAGWTSWTFWQYTSSANVSGVSVATDASYLNSSALELAQPVSQSDRAGSKVSLGLSGLDGGPAASYSATGLPAGLSINASNGEITGTLPGGPSSFPVSVSESAAGVSSVSQSFTWHVHGPVTLGHLRDLSGSVGSPARLQLAAADGLGGCTLQFTASGLPRGLTISRCGLISGWPMISGGYRVTVRVTDSSGRALAQRSFEWSVSRASGQGPSGHIRLNRNGKCLAEISATDIAIEPCNSGAAQRWTLAADGSVRVNGLCLAARTAAKSAPAALELTSCAKGGQRWQAESGAALLALSDGRCLAGNGAQNGSRATAAVCAQTSNSTGSAGMPSPSQQWTLPAGPLTSGMGGLCASDLAGSGDAAGTVTLRRCSTAPGHAAQQAWTLEPDGALAIAGQCLGLAAGAVAPGTPVQLSGCSDAADQVWQIDGGPVGVQLVSPEAGLCLADPGDRARSGTVLVIGPCVAGDPGVSWRVS